MYGSLLGCAVAMKPAFTFKRTAFDQAAFICAELPHLMPPIKHPCPESYVLACPYPPGEDDTTARVLEPPAERKRYKPRKPRVIEARIAAASIVAHEPLTPRERPQESVAGLIEDASTAPGGTITLRYGRICIEVTYDKVAHETAFLVNGWPMDQADFGRYLDRIQSGVPVKAP